MPPLSPAEAMAALDIITFGCRLNAFESEVIRRAAGEVGLQDAVIVNTCAVTAEAERQARRGATLRARSRSTPSPRGRGRSVPVGDIIDQARALVERGCREIVLTGVALTAYGLDLPGQPSLGRIVRRLLRAVPELPRL